MTKRILTIFSIGFEIWQEVSNSTVPENKM